MSVAAEGLHGMRTLAAFVPALGRAFGDAPAIELDGSVLTYRELDERSARLARGLLHRGVGKGSRIALRFTNGPDFAVAVAAITRIGAVAVPLSTLLRPPELARVLRHGDVHAVLSQPSYLGHDFAEELRQAVPGLVVDAREPLYLVDAPFLRWVCMLDEGDLLDGPVPDGILAAVEREVHADDPALLIYTSGQSADPKGVVHSHGGVMRKTHQLCTVFGFDRDSRVPGQLPFFWVGGMVMSLFPVFAAGGMVVCRRAPMRDAPMLGAVGASRPDFKARGSQSKFLVGLGMTETFGPYSFGVEPPDPDVPLCPPLTVFEPGYDVKVVDGEIALRGPTVMLGLHKVERSETFDADGYYRTGDRAEARDGTVYFTGRLGDMIKVSGANVAPAEVEREILAIVGVAAAHVVGVDDGDRGQVVGAAVVTRDGAPLDGATVLATLRERLSSYKVPKLLCIVDPGEIPQLPSGKIARRELAALIRQKSGIV
jgi:acyl-CoA synthetase (AMP-forming)/AMP-acid ligase II